MKVTMSQKSLKEYIPRVKERYQRMTGKEARGRVLDEFCEISGFERKYAIKVLCGNRRTGKGPGRGGAPTLYGAEVVSKLKDVWQSMEQPCGKRMEGMMPLWVVHWKGLEKEIEQKLLKMSGSSMDRLLRGAKIGPRKKPLVPRSDSAIKAQVEIRAECWNTQEVGWTEVDTVAHCGGDMGGNFIWSLTSVEILSGWTEVRCVWNRGQGATFRGLQEIEKAQPFTLRGIDSDGGGEFLNHHLYDYLKGRKIKQTRSRPYRKNDQAHVEQKNYTHVRQLLGYERLEQSELLAPINELLAEWSLWKNLYCTTMEQVSSTRKGSQQKRQHVKRTQTPAQRLQASGKLSAEQEQRIQKLLKVNNPFTMKQQIEAKLKAIWKMRAQLLELEINPRRLACLDLPTLRSEKSKQAKQLTNKELATVS